MSWYEALILGLVQGFTEFLPVSSSGHLELGRSLLGVEAEAGFSFTLAVHGATVLSTVVVFREEIIELLRGVFRFKMNSETRYVMMLIWSAIPVGIIGVFFKDDIESLFSGNIVFVGAMLLVTSGLLFLTRFFADRERSLTPGRVLIIGIAQAMAVMPGISRSGATIATGMMLGISRDKIAAFSFLMVLAPVLGANIIEFAGRDHMAVDNGLVIIAIGFISAFFSGYIACRVMISLVKRSKLIGFSLYCLVIGLLAIML